MLIGFEPISLDNSNILPLNYRISLHNSICIICVKTERLCISIVSNV